MYTQFLESIASNYQDHLIPTLKMPLYQSISLEHCVVNDALIRKYTVQSLLAKDVG